MLVNRFTKFMENIIYHYTTSNASFKIFASGYLKVSEWEKKNKVKPAALWLSLNQQWENSATKMVLKPNGETTHMSFEEQHSKFGCARFVLPFKKEYLCSWPKYKHVANNSMDIYEAMEKIGLLWGANPKDWYASFNNIPIAEILGFEVWNGNNWINKI